MKLSGAVLVRPYFDDSVLNQDLPLLDAEFTSVSPVVLSSGKTDSSKLYVCDAATALKHAPDNPGTFFLAVSGKKESGRFPENIMLLETELTAEEVYTDIDDYFHRVQDWVENMRIAVTYGASLQELVDMSEEIIGQYIAISDYAFRLIAYTKNIKNDDEISAYLREHGVHSDETIEKLKSFGLTDLWNKYEFYAEDKHDLLQYATAGFVYRFGNTYFNHAVMTMNTAYIRKDSVYLFRIFGECIKPIVSRDWEKEELFTHMYDSLLAELIRDNQLSRETIRIRAGYSKVPYTGRFLLFVIPIIRGSGYSISRVGNELHCINPNSYVSLVDSELLLLECFNEKDFEERSAKVIREISRVLDENSLVGGGGSLFTELYNMSAAYLQAKRAIDTQMQLGRSECDLKDCCVLQECFMGQHKSLILFDDVFEYCFCDYSAEKFEMLTKSRYFKALKALHDYDIQHRMNNLQLLRVYLENERRISETAVRMHMHRNNVTYRLQKIKELTGLDLDSANERLRILITYSMLNQTDDIAEAFKRPGDE